MQTKIFLKPVKITPTLLRALQRRGLIRALAPTNKILNTRTATGAVDTFYRTKSVYGTHKLIGIGKRSLKIKLCTHPACEDFIVINPTEIKYKPLYIIIARHKRAALEKKARSGKLSAKDFFTVEWEYNNPRTCVFTMLADTVHCEVTAPGPGQHPVFFVTEPSQLPLNYVNIYTCELDVQTA
ncbi:MAG: hypothetical protein ABSH12_07575 [Endomicrobiales bacterium]|jgi:hypothetical protein